MSKKSSGFKTEDEVLRYLENVVKKEKYCFPQTKGSYLRSIPPALRTSNVCAYILQHNNVFYIRKEIPYMSLDILTEDMIIKSVYDFPSLLCPVDPFGNYRGELIPEKKQTLPVLVAFEIGKRRYERVNRQHYEYPEKAYKYIKTIRQLADKIMSEYDDDFINHSFSFTGKCDDENDLFVEELVKLIKKQSEEYNRGQDRVVTHADIAKADMEKRVSNANFSNIEAMFGNTQKEHY